MEVNGIINMLEDMKKSEEKLKKAKIMQENKKRIFYITLETVAGNQVKLELSEEFSVNLLKFVVEQATKDYEKKIEELKKMGVSVTNVFEKEKIENKIKKYKKELDDLWGRGLFTRGEEVQKYIEELESELKEL